MTSGGISQKVFPPPPILVCAALLLQAPCAFLFFLYYDFYVALAGKSNESKRFPDLPVNGEQASSFIGGFSPEKLAVNALLDATKRQPIHNKQSSPHGKGMLPPLPQPPTFVVAIPSPQSGKQSLTMQHALNTIAAPVILSPSSPHSNSLLPPGPMAYPSASAGVRSHPALDVTPNSRPRAVSVPPSPLSPSATAARSLPDLQMAIL
ncbi:hypothetical protein EDB19DRAFT_2035315 [Suillus lakei]|nr:hypothetical protein EDB19DRAFT_2035315 [Suillus lakei]